MVAKAGGKVVRGLLDAPTVSHRHAAPLPGSCWSKPITRTRHCR